MDQYKKEILEITKKPGADKPEHTSRLTPLGAKAAAKYAKRNLAAEFKPHSKTVNLILKHATNGDFAKLVAAIKTIPHEHRTKLFNHLVENIGRAKEIATATISQRPQGDIVENGAANVANSLHLAKNLGALKD